jgi:uncharacterized damage-inducible protein DinB
MATIADYLKRPVSERLECMRRTPDDLADAIRGRSDAELSRRPDEKNWSAEEIVCHLRDVEREYIERFHLVLENDDPKIYMEADGNERWPVDLQYHRNDTADAASAFRRLRDEMTTLLSGLTAGELQRGGIHPRRGRVTIDSWVAMLVVHDADHLDQLKRALNGSP